MVLTLFIIAAACMLIAIHPFVTYPLSLWVLRKIRGEHRRHARHPGESRDPEARPRVPGPAPAPGRRNAAPLTFAVCMCAYNEERVIEAKMRNLLALREREPGLAIHIYVDAATDRTSEILGRHADAIDLHVSGERHGKTYGMNLLSARASADILVFTDANVMLDQECLQDLRRHFADPEIGCVCGNLTYTNGDASVTAASGSLYWRFEEALKRLESATGSMMGADGSVFAIRRHLRRAPPDHIIDDMYVSLMTIVEGHRLIQASDVRAYEESVTKPGEEFSRKVRIACQAFNVHRLIWPKLRQLDALTRYKYISHKFLRWLCIYFFGAAALAFSGALILAGKSLIALALIAGGAVAFVLGARGVRPFAQLVDLFTALAGAGVGVWRSMRGERFQTWTPAASIRTGASQ
jgi:cellulose synthase/poly-beta-1,6-N-acetylglucosamine synthase-like glycosyltransferase